MRHSRRSSETYLEVATLYLCPRMSDEDGADHCGLNALEQQEKYQNQDPDQDHPCQTPSQEHVIQENLSV